MRTTIIRLLPVFSALIFQANVLKSAPIQLQVTSVQEGNTNCNGFTVRGANFQFSANITGYCSGPGIYGEPGGSFFSSVNIYAPPTDQQFVQGRGPTLGTIDVPENPGRVAYFTGSITAYGSPVPIPFDARGSGQLQLSTPVFLQGSLTACLLPAGAFSGGSCDPNYINFATVNFYVAGTDVFTGSIPSFAFGGYFREEFTGVGVASPEPATFALMGIAAFGALFHSSLRRKRSPSEGHSQISKI